MGRAVPPRSDRRALARRRGPWKLVRQEVKPGSVFCRRGRPLSWPSPTKTRLGEHSVDPESRWRSAGNAWKKRREAGGQSGAKLLDRSLVGGSFLRGVAGCRAAVWRERFVVKSWPLRKLRGGGPPAPGARSDDREGISNPQARGALEARRSAGSPSLYSLGGGASRYRAGSSRKQRLPQGLMQRRTALARRG